MIGSETLETVQETTRRHSCESRNPETNAMSHKQTAVYLLASKPNSRLIHWRYLWESRAGLCVFTGFLPSQE